MSKIRLAIAGVGNCASSLVQGLAYYRGKDSVDTAGLLHPELGGYGLSDIKIVAAFDVDRRKVGRPIEEAIFAPPSCTTVFQRELPSSGVTVAMAPPLDGVAAHMEHYPEAQAFRVSDEHPCDVGVVLRESRADARLAVAGPCVYDPDPQALGGELGGWNNTSPAGVCPRERTVSPIWRKELR